MKRKRRGKTRLIALIIISILITVLMYALCIFSAIDREQEDKEQLEWIKNLIDTDSKQKEKES